MAKKKITKESKRRLMIFGILSIVFIVYFCVTMISYIVNYSSLKNEENNLNKELINLQNEKKELKTEILKLNDPDYIVRYAKEKYLYSKDGEYVIKIEDNNIFETTEKKESYTVYIVLGIIAFILCLLFLKKKNTSKWSIL